MPEHLRSDAKYCSDQCRANSYNDRHRDRIRDEWREKTPRVEEVRTCACGGGDFVPGRSDQIYCSEACNKKAYERRRAQEIAEKNAEKKEERRLARLARMALPRAIRACSVEGCEITSEDDPALKPGRCNVHYLREYRADLRAEVTGAARLCRRRMTRRFDSWQTARHGPLSNLQMGTPQSQQQRRSW